MKKLVKGFVLATILISGLGLISCEKNEISPEKFANDPPTTNDPQRPPN